MTGAMYAAVAGLRAHMTALNVIGHNISNVNTLGYKSARYTFSEALYTTNRTGSNGTETMGGRNPAQIGYGCSIGTIDLDMSSKNYTPTGYALDCTIDGDGFFLVSDKTKSVTNQSELNGMSLTRLGNFDVKDGYLVDGDGNVVYGFLATGYDPVSGKTTFEENPTLTALRIPYGKLVDVTDEDGNIVGQKTVVGWPTVNDEGMILDATRADFETQNVEIGDNEALERVSTNSFSIGEIGDITITTSTGQSFVIGYIAIGKVDSPNGLTHVDGRYYQALGGAGNVHLSTVGGALTSTVNGEDEESNHMVIESAGATKLITGGLESSGTDLAGEITNMICIQRGYQANTRIVSVTDSMLEELVNMKR